MFEWIQRWICSKKNRLISKPTKLKGLRASWSCLSVKNHRRKSLMKKKIKIDSSWVGLRQKFMAFHIVLLLIFFLSAYPLWLFCNITMILFANTQSVANKRTGKQTSKRTTSRIQRPMNSMENPNIHMWFDFIPTSDKCAPQLAVF